MTDTANQFTSMPAILSVRDVSRYINLSKSSIYEKLDQSSKYCDPTFPRPVLLGARRKGFRRAELDQWLENLVA